MSSVLKALAWISPRAAMARARALTALDHAPTRRGYDGAKGGRRAASFGGGGGSANVEVGPALSRLRARSRDLARNTWAGRRILDVTVAHAIGTGITAVPATGSDRTDRQLGDAWKEWIATADVEGVLCFGGLQALALSAMLEGGDAVIRRIRRPLAAGGRTVPLALQLLEGDHIDSSRDGTVEGRRARLGIGLGDWNARTGCWLYADHPGDNTFQAASLTSTFVERAGLAHLHRPTRPGQFRGVPVFAPVLMSARDLADLMDAVIVKQKVEACFAAFVTTTDQGEITGVGKKTDKDRVEQLVPGMVNYLGQGEDVTFGTPTSSGGAEPIMLRVLYALAAGAGITYDQLTGDLRQANYSSLRAGKIEFRRLVEQLQWLTLVPQVMRPVTGWFLEAGTLSGVLPTTSRNKLIPWRFDFVMPAIEPIDPKKDLEADILAVRAGRMTPQEFIGGWGRDWREVVDDFEGFLTVIDRKKLVFDIDPRRTSQIGVAQTPPAEPGSVGKTDPDDEPKPVPAAED